MPNINEYNPNVGQVDTSAFERAARRVQVYGSQEAETKRQQGVTFARDLGQGIKDVGEDVNDYQTYQDRTNVGAKSAQALASIESDWQETLNGKPDPDHSGQYLVPPADPNDPNIAKRFMAEKVQPVLDDINNTPLSSGGSRYAQEKTDALMEHLTQKFTADMGTLKQDAVVINHQKTVDGLGAAVALDPTFHNLDYALKAADDDMKGHLAGAGMNAHQVAQLTLHGEDAKRQIVHAAAVSAIMKPGVDPEKTAQAFIKKYPEYIKPEEEIQLARAATSSAKMNASIDRANKLAEKQEAQFRGHRMANDIVENVIENNGQVSGKNVQALKDAYKKDPAAFDANPHLLKETYDWLNARASRETGTSFDPESYNSAYKMLITGEDGAGKPLSDAQLTMNFMNMNANGQLSDKQFAHLSEVRKGIDEVQKNIPGFQDAMKAVDAHLTITLPGMGGGHDPVGQGDAANVKAAFIPLLLDKVRKGTFTPKDIDANDPKSLLGGLVAERERGLSEKLNDRMRAMLLHTGAQRVEEDKKKSKLPLANPDLNLDGNYR